MHVRRIVITTAAALALASTFEAYSDWVESEDRAGRRRPSPVAVRMRYVNWNSAKRMVAASGARTPTSLHTRRKISQDVLWLARLLSTRLKMSSVASWQILRRLLHLKSRQSWKSSLRLTGKNLKYARRRWLRAVVELDPQVVERRLQQGGLSRSQRDALQHDPPNISAALSDIYLDRMLSGYSGGPCNTDSWLGSEAQAELDALPDDIVARVDVLHEIRNFLTHSSEEAKNRLRTALAHLASEDSRFTLRRSISRRVLLDWLTAEHAQRRRQSPRLFLRHGAP